MAGHSDTNYSSKGWCFGYFIIFLILLVLTIIYVYNGNWNALETNAK
jgi:hypothetical protein